MRRAAAGHRGRVLRRPPHPRAATRGALRRGWRRGERPRAPPAPADAERRPGDRQRSHLPGHDGAGHDAVLPRETRPSGEAEAGTLPDAGSWRQKGEEVCAALAESGRRVVLAIDELPILVNRMLKDDDYRITPAGRREVDAFLSWLRRCGQDHRERICLIVSGSVGLEPILHQAGLSAHANIFSPMQLRPWDEQTALDCLAALAATCRLDLPLAVRRDMCRRLRCLVPHHVQRFFDSLDEDLRLAGRRQASVDDVERVYTREMLGIRGQADLDHYESRLKLVLGSDGYRDALDLLTEAAVNGGVLRCDAVVRYREYFRARAAGDPVPLDDVLRVLEHDGYLEPRGDDYRFVSGLLEDWWRARHGRYFVPIERRVVRHGA